MKRQPIISGDLTQALTDSRVFSVSSN